MLIRPYQMSMCWWEGVVENRFDPLKIGRVQVRVLGIHTDNLQQLPESDLHWMQVMMPVTSASNSGVGETSGLVEGSHVIGFFRDGDSCQDGIVMGSTNGIPQESRDVNKGFSDHRVDLSATKVPGKPSKLEYTDSGVSITEFDRTPYPQRLDEPDLSRLATGINLEKDTTISSKIASQHTQIDIPIAGGESFSEPAVNFKAMYPYNKVTETESGHIIELDDTPSHERVHIFHRSGSFVEMLHNGDVVVKTTKDEYNIVHANRYSHVNGTDVLTVDNGSKILINKGLELEINDGNININVKSGNVNLTVNGDISQKVSGDYVMSVGGRFKVSASRIDLN
jgi:hypothetical protein